MPCGLGCLRVESAVPSLEYLDSLARSEGVCLCVQCVLQTLLVLRNRVLEFPVFALWVCPSLRSAPSSRHLRPG